MRGLVAGRNRRPDQPERGTLDHGIDALINLSWISLTMYLRHWSCARHAASGDWHRGLLKPLTDRVL
jgi:hypothetical protein